MNRPYGRRSGIKAAVGFTRSPGVRLAGLTLLRREGGCGEEPQDYVAGGKMEALRINPFNQTLRR